MALAQFRCYQRLPLKGILLSILTSTVMGWPTLALLAQAPTSPGRSTQSTPSQGAPLVGVVQSTDNVGYWQDIVSRLHRTAITYRVIDWQQVQDADDLEGVSILFLPNVETITVNQIEVLETWVEQGGQLVVSGPVGEQSPQRVRRRLQALLGAYWAFPLTQPGTLESVETAIRSWGIDAETDLAVTGGVIIPTGPSQTAAIWDVSSEAGQSSSGLNYNGSAAVVVTARTVFLGWNWGETTSEAASLDSIWLQAIVERYGTVQATTTNFPAPSSTTPASPSRTVLYNDTPIRVTPSSPTVPQTQPTRPTTLPPVSSNPSPSPASPSPSSRSTPPSLSPSPSPTPASPQPTATRCPIPLSPCPSSLTVPQSTLTNDPAEQVAPAGLPVEISDLPITTIEAIAMRQELIKLIGRFESALLAANSVSSDITFQTTQVSSNPKKSDDVLVASTTGQGQGEAIAMASTNTAVQRAREILEEFPNLLEQQEYTLARQQWLEARQTLWENFPTDRPLAQPEVRAMWLDRGTIVAARSRRGLEQLFDQLAAAGVNTVFFETVNAGYTIYPSQVAPQQNPLTRGWDPLQDAVELAHERGMELHAWVWTFAAGNTRHNDILNLPDSYPGPILEAHPDWANYDDRGSVIPPGQTKPFLDPANPAVRSYLLRLFQEIATNYDVDGLQLDYIRYPFQDPSAGRSYGYGMAARQQFQRLTGVDPTTISPGDRQLWERWTAFRTEQINSFVADTSRLLRDINPDLVLSTAVFAFSEHERIQEIQQNWEVWAERGDVDMIVTMSYAQDTDRLQRLVDPWLTDPALDSVIILPSIRLLNLPEAATVDQIQAIRDMPATGFALFATADLNASLLDIFSHTQGNTTHFTGTSDPLPYRQPFQTAVARFDTLEREWNFLVGNGQLWVDDAHLAEWTTQAQALGVALDQLASNPSAQNFATAQATLTQFRTEFEDWTELQSLRDSYRVETWNNRLAALDVLLNYGERFVLNR